MKIIFKTFQIFFGIILMIVGGYHGVKENNFRYIKSVNDNKELLTTDNFHYKFSGHRRNKREQNLLHINHRYENFNINKNCGGVFKSFQTILYSPNYSPNNFYSSNLICDYSIESPFLCPNEFHIQFLDFQLEKSYNCEKDFLNIQNDILCGKIIGIKRYNSTDGILRIRFQTDNENENKGFKLLITRQPCVTGTNYSGTNSQDYRESINENNIIEDNISNVSMEKLNSKENLITVHSKYISRPENFILPSVKDVREFENTKNNGNRDKFNNKQSLSLSPQTLNTNGYLPSFNTNGYLPSSYPGVSLGSSNQIPTNSIYNNLSPSLICYPAGDRKQPHIPIQPPQYYPPQFPFSGSTEYPQIISSSNVFRNQFTPQYYPSQSFNDFINTRHEEKRVESQVAPWLTQTLPQCCGNIFRQKHFYLSSPLFPRYANYLNDCLYSIEKFSANICRLRIEFKFFNLGTQSQIRGIEYTELNIPQVVCLEDFIEIDGQRLCGCRSDLVYTSQWGMGAKVIRMRLGGNRIAQNSGFVLDIRQEDCPYRYQRNQRDINGSTNLYPKAILETNSTTRTSLYLKKTDVNNEQSNSEKQLQIDTREGPNSQFFFLVNHQQNRCIFTLSDYYRLTLDSLWISKPVCVARRFAI